MARAHPSSNLEAPTSAFIGRDDELATLRGLLDEQHRLLTLVGPAGVGKTQLALALALARAHAQTGRGEVFFCDLSEARTRDELCTCVVHALDLKGALEHGEARVGRVGEDLAGRGPVLLVLDNFEQLVEQAPATLGAWLRAAPEARFVVTSRLRLRLDGERVYPVTPMEAPDAEALFLYRVSLIRPGFVVSAEDREVLAEVLEGLDRLPLAIELAAARMQLMGIRELRDRLSARLELLRSGRRDAPPRQSSLENALDWSWQQLAPWERSALLQCTRFRGGFDLTAAAAVIDLSDFPAAPSTLDVVQALVEQSMLRARDVPAPVGARRLSLLRTIRDFVAAQAPPEHTRDTARRHAQFYAELGEALGERWENRRDVSALPLLGLERENLLAAATSVADPRLALRAALGLHPVVAAWGPFEPQLELLERSFSAARRGDLEPRAEARALLARGRLEIACIGVAAAEQSWSRAATLAAGVGDDELEGRARHGLAATAHTRGDLGAAVEQYGLALERLRRGPRRRAYCLALLDLALLHAEQGAMQAALDRVDEAAATTEGVDDLTGAVLTLRGGLHLDTGDLLAARESLHAAQEVSRAGGYRLLEGKVLGELAVLALLEAPSEARPALEEARLVLEQVGDRRMQCAALGYRAVEAHLRGALQEAGPRYELAYRKAQDLGIERLSGFLAAWSAMALADGERLEAARDRVEHAAAAVDDPLIAAALDLAKAQRGLARARAAQSAGRAPRAVTLVRAARAMASAHRHRAGLTASSRDLRLTRMLFERSLRSTAANLGAPELGEESRARIAVDAAGRWFRLDEEPARDTGRRQAVRRLLVTLARAHVESPGVPLSRAELVSAVWEGEKMGAESAKNRLNVTLSLLRKLGLRDQVLTDEGGYLFDPSADVSVEHDDPLE